MDKREDESPPSLTKGTHTVYVPQGSLYIVIHSLPIIVIECFLLYTKHILWKKMEKQIRMYISKLYYNCRSLSTNIPMSLFLWVLMCNYIIINHN